MASTKTGTKKREKTGGRTAGTPNKLTAQVREELIDKVGLVQFYADYINGKPFEYTDKDGNTVTEVAPLKDRRAAADKLLDYIVPKPKEVEPTGDAGGADGGHEQWLDMILKAEQAHPAKAH